MSIRVGGQALKFVAFVGIVFGAATLSGCTTLGSAAFGDVTGSTASPMAASGSQTMPAALQPVGTKVAQGPYVPPADIGGGSGVYVTGSAPLGTVSTSTLPPLSGTPAMSTSTAPAIKSASLGTLPQNSSTPALAVVPNNPYIHVIESGESLYTIARRYDVTAQAVVQANGLGSPDKIFVGQKLIIPGRSAMSPAPAAPAHPTTVVASTGPVATVKPLAATPVAADVAAPAPLAATPVVKPAPVVAAAEPAMSGAEKFRWPVSGKVITDFIASKQTGINIEAPDGAAIRAAENGQVIYVGSGVEGYGNLVLIRHANGYVSAYAHLKTINVQKNQNVSRGDTIGLAGMTGSVSRPQLHFELRKGATPVDPIPLLAG
jgi:murein DD-endopeptidase MepM/ murein hydrolase activator NlpD